MKSFKIFIQDQQIFEATGGGDCYSAAYKFLDKLHNTEASDNVLVHGLVNGQGKLTGIKYNHAWVEDASMVYDYSNGRQIVLPKDLYYRLGKIKEQEVFRYTSSEMYKNASKFGTYGPWEKKLLKNKY
jgi:hypothetical protein